MLIAIDVGNTHVVIGLFEGEVLSAIWRLRSDANKTVDEYAIDLTSLLTQGGFVKEKISQVIISCVVPALTRVFHKLSGKYLKVDPIIVGPGVKTGIEISVDDPRSVGADRIVNAVACKKLFGVPGIVVDFGTATTFDVISSRGVYQGGLIAPGIIISLEALANRAAMLPSVDLIKPAHLIGKNTRDSMLSGIFFGYASLVDGLLCRLKKEMGSSVKVVATGGLARTIAAECAEVDEVSPDLTLFGLKIVAELNR